MDQRDVDAINNALQGKSNIGEPNSQTPPAASSQSTPDTATPTAAASAHPAAASAQQTQQSQTEPPAGASDPEEETIDLESLGFSDFEEIRTMRDQMIALQRQNEELSQYKDGPVFKSERHRLLYQMSAAAEGQELSKLSEIVRLHALDLENLPDQQIRWEAFKLSPENSALSEDEMQALFNDRERAFEENESLGKIHAKQATVAAKKALTSARSEWESARAAEPTPEQVAQDRVEYRNYVAEKLDAFKGLSLDVVGINEKGERISSKFNFDISEENDRGSVVSALADPAGWWDDMMYKTGIMTPGSQEPNWQKFAELVSFINNRDRIISSAYTQGRQEQMAEFVKGSRNVALPGSQSGQAPAPPATKKQEMAEVGEQYRRAMGFN